MKQFSLFELQQFEGYDTLKGILSEAELQIFYNVPKEQRGGVLPNKTLTRVVPKLDPIKVPIISSELVVKISTQKCTFNDVFAMANEYMLKTFVVDGRAFNMRDMGVHLEFNDNKSRWGFAKRSGRHYTISLSKWMCDNTKATMADWIDTMLHEMAHVIDYVVRGRSDHSYRWVHIATTIGCSGERTAKVDFEDDIQTKYTTICNNCGKESHKHKKVRVGQACGKCCREHNGGRYSDKYILRIVQNY